MPLTRRNLSLTDNGRASSGIQILEVYSHVITTKPTIVFCHGIWADGSCFSKVIPALQADGHEVIAGQYGLDSFEEDVATVKRTLNRVGSPVLLVGHSYGGATIYGLGCR